jgi:hypothetical protein
MVDCLCRAQRSYGRMMGYGLSYKKSLLCILSVLASLSGRVQAILQKPYISVGIFVIVIKPRRTDVVVGSLDELLSHVEESIDKIMKDPQTTIDNYVYCSLSVSGDLRSYSLEDIENSLGLYSR